MTELLDNIKNRDPSKVYKTEQVRKLVFKVVTLLNRDEYAAANYKS